MLSWEYPAPGCSARRPEDDPLSDTVTPAPIPAETADEPSPGPDQVLALVLKSLGDDLAEDIVTIDLRGRSAMADFMVIASGRSARHVAAIADKLIERLKAGLGRSPRAEGKEAADWVLVDTDDVVVHLFRPEVREFYQLEKMWMAPDALAELRRRQPHLLGAAAAPEGVTPTASTASA